MANIYAVNGKIYLNIRVNGKRIRRATGLKDNANNRKKVERDLPELVMKLKMGEISFDKPRDSTVSYYADVLLDNSEKTHSPSTQKKYRTISRHVVKKFGSRQIDEVRVSEVKAWVNDLLKTKSAKTVINYMIVFRNIFQEALYDEAIERNPFNHIKPPKKEKPEIQPFTREETTLLLEFSSGWFRNLLALLAYTGMRTGEALALKWSDIDFKEKEIHIQRAINEFGLGKTKTSGSVRYVPIFNSLLPYLKTQYEITGGVYEFVFISKLGTPFKKTVDFNASTWKPLLVSLGMKHRRLYDLRHTFATNMLGSGQFSAMQIARWLGHTNTQMLFTTYARYIKSERVEIDKSFDLFEI